MLDSIAEAEKVQVSQDELTQYLVQGAAQYGMDPNEFVQILSQNGQIPAMVGEVARNKALAIALGKAKVSDAEGKAVDLSEFTAVADARGRGRQRSSTRPKRSSKRPKPPRSPRRRSARRSEAPQAEADATPKKPARKRTTKKADAE